MATAKEIQGIVTAVDIRRGVCKVICHDGRLLTNVGWKQAFGGLGRSGLNYSPVPRERVYIQMQGSGDFVITGSARPSVFSRTDSITLGNLGYAESETFYRRYNASMNSTEAESGNSRPVDQIPGDVTITQGGGILGVTNTGSILAKASTLAQIFISKVDDIVRVVTRNYQQFSEASKKVQESVMGRVYQYHAWYHTRESSFQDLPEYEEIIGDVAAGESKKGEYESTSTLPAQDARVYKRHITKDTETRYTEESTVDGETTSVSTDATSNTVTENFDNNRWRVHVTDGSSNTHTELLATSATITTAGGGNVTLIFNEDGTASISGSTSLLVEFPEVNVECDTALVNATDSITANATNSATVTTASATVSASTSIVFDSPLATFTGLVQLGAIALNPSFASAATPSATITGTTLGLDASSDISFGSTTLKTHTHTGDGASSPPGSTSPPIGAS